MKTISESTTYLGIIIEYTADVYPPEKDVGYTFPIIENLEIQSFGGIDWELLEFLLRTHVIETIEMRCREHAVALAMSEEVV